MRSNFSVPEPPPIPQGSPVPDRVYAIIAELEELDIEGTPEHVAKTRKSLQSLRNLIEQRDNFGKFKYGQRLMTEDGRNGIEDAKQELGDFTQYYTKCWMNNDPNLTELYEMFLIVSIYVKWLNLKRGSTV